MELQEFKSLFEQTQAKYPYVFEKRHPGYFNKILMYWDVPIEADAYFSKIASASQGIAADAQLDLTHIRDVYKKWRNDHRPRASLSILTALSTESIPVIMPTLLPPTQENIALLRSAFELIATDSPKIVDFLRLKNIPANQRDVDGISLLCHATQRGNENSAIALMRAGANPHMVDSMGNTPLHWAVIQNKRRMAEMLLYFGASPNTPNSAGATPYFLSVIKDDSTIAQRLYEYGADISSHDAIGNTPLHKAVSSGSIENVWLLLIAGAASSARNKAGITPFELAEKNPEIMRIFDKHQVAIRQAA